MKRKIEETLAQWKGSSRRKPLIVNGARQVGKTYSVLSFAQKEFAHVVHVDFSAQKNVAALFDGDIVPEALLPQIEAAFGVDITPDSTLLFFDEVQACPRALTSLKYFYERAPQYYVVAAGSLLGVSLAREEYSYPVGKVDAVTLYPLDFEEFLWALGEKKLADLIRVSYEKDVPLGLHNKALSLYKRYVFTGGMPEAVNAAVEGALPHEVRVIQQNLLDGYLADMTKYASPVDSARILGVWRGVPEQLAKDNHKFQYATIESSARAHQYEAAIQWLRAAGMVSFCCRVREPRRPLRSFAEWDYFKLYVLDVGLLGVLQGANEEDLEPASDKGSRLRGGIAENYVMQQLVAQGVEPFYWGIASKGEVDFLVQRENGDVLPIEVKSGVRVSARSLESYRKKYEPSVSVRVSARNFGFENGIKSVPLYAAFCLA